MFVPKQKKSQVTETDLDAGAKSGMPAFVYGVTEISKYALALPEQTAACYRAMQGKQLLVTVVSLAERHEGGSLARFKANIAVWHSNESELSCFVCFMGKSCPPSTRLHPHSYWRGVSGVAVPVHLASDPQDVPWLFQEPNLYCRLPRALMTTL